MLTVINDFNKRVKEIDEYYDHLNKIINEDAQLYFEKKRTHRVKSVDEDLIKVMKANCFLLLYNLIESSIKASITELYDSISNEKIKYEDLIPNIKKIWIREKYRNFREKGTDFIFDSIENLAGDIVEIQFNSEKTISGNIDGMKIREFSEKYGFSNSTHRLAKKGERLHQVKVQRNKLAHGELSFSECGRNYTYEDLEEIKKQVVIHLRGILLNIKKYINSKAYKE